MSRVVFIKPDFYNSFKCIAGDCSDSCCIGWEITVDEKTKAKYKKMNDAFGEKIMANLTTDEDGFTCFKLSDNERCPFLNEKKLCDIIINKGEEFLCDICTEHPRFYNEFPLAVECGLGLCCEEVCRLLLENEAPFELESEPAFEEKLLFDEALCEDYTVLSEIREAIFNILKGDEAYSEKLEGIVTMLEAAGENVRMDTDEELLASYKKTEPINEEWVEYFCELQKNVNELLQKEKPFDEATNGDKLYSKILSYIIFRHLGSCLYNESSSLGECLSFCISAVRFIKLCDMKTYHEKGTLTLSDRIENVKRWSKQIEYSDLNVDMLTK